MSVRQPIEPTYDIADDRFGDIIDPVARLVHLADGCTWAEGPVYLADDTLLWSDVRNNRRMRLDVAIGAWPGH